MLAERKVNVISTSGPPIAVSSGPKPIQNRWAFLVGINRYVDKSAFSPLNFCIRDVKALKSTLHSLNYTAVCLHDGLDSDDARFPNLSNIEAELTTLCDEDVREDDLLWVHFACHGMLLDGQPVLIARDTREATLAKTALSLATVKALMQRSKAKRLILTLDACHTGVDIGRGSTDHSDFIKHANELAEGFALISASTAQQVAQECADAQHGIFTKFLLAGLKGEAKRSDQSIITVNDLQTYVLHELRKWKAEHGGQQQEPTCSVEGVGDIPLVDLKAIKLNVSLKGIEISYSKIEIVNRTIAIRTSRGSIETFEEVLGDRLALEMAIIPRGKFLMGSPQNESKRLDSEGPQHQVTIDRFCLSRTLVTQSQWRAVARLPEVKIPLDLDPSGFKGRDRDDHPVEQVSWFEAVEFCERLSQKTGRSYRLPSEAEWEYACRASTDGPFHCGETISTDLANYRGTNYKEEGMKFNGFYGRGSQGRYLKQTTEVKRFAPNAFGLYDMHGNLYEWCADDWDDDYENAPSDSRIRTGGGFTTHRVLRGGSWATNPDGCRSASRLGYNPQPKIKIIGFRVACELL